MRQCKAQSWSDNGRLRNLDCPEASAWRVSFEDGTVSGYPCDKHVADYLHFNLPSVVTALTEEET